jgi:hypothetical protein
MPTHDYNIANQSASAFRTDLNLVLQAILSQNSNPTAPATTAANMIWYDSTNKQIKKRNEADSAWITLGTIDEGAGTFTPTGQRALSSQAQAEAGTDNTTVMTPLRAAQAIAVLSPAYVDTVLLGTLTTTSGSSQTLSGLVLTPYKFLHFTLNGVSTTITSSETIGLGTATSLFGGATGAIAVSGMGWVDLGNGIGTAVTRLGTVSTVGAGATGYSTATTSVSVNVSGGTFDAGTIRIYGVK